MRQNRQEVTRHTSWGWRWHRHDHQMSARRVPSRADKCNGMNGNDDVVVPWGSRAGRPASAVGAPKAKKAARVQGRHRRRQRESASLFYRSSKLQVRNGRFKSRRVHGLSRFNGETDKHGTAISSDRLPSGKSDWSCRDGCLLRERKKPRKNQLTSALAVSHLIVGCS